MAETSSQRSGLAKSLSSAFGFGSKGAYDDVFVNRPQMRAPRFTPRMKDYNEIFNCSNPSTIPVLDLDKLENGEAGGGGFCGGDWSSAEVDYGNVFGAVAEAKVGKSVEELFCADGDVRRKADVPIYSKETDHFTTMVDRQKMAHGTLRRKNLSMPVEKTTRRGESETDEPMGPDKVFAVPVVSTRPLGEFGSLKSVEENRSDRTTNSFKQSNEEASTGKHTRRVSSGRLPYASPDEYIEIDVRSKDGRCLDESISSDIPKDTTGIRSKAGISEVITASGSIPDLGTPSASLVQRRVSKPDTHISNIREGDLDGINCYSQQDVKFHSVHYLDGSLGRLNSQSSKVISSSGSSYQLGGATTAHEMQKGNPSVCKSNNGENATGDTNSHSQQDVKIQKVHDLQSPCTINVMMDANVARPEAPSSNPTPVADSQGDLGTVNTAFKDDITSKTMGSRKAANKGAEWGANGYLRPQVKYQNEADIDDSSSSDVPVDAYVANRKANSSKQIGPSDPGKVGPTLRTGMATTPVELRSACTNAKDDPLSTSSDDEVDENSELAVTAATAKKIMREAQAWIDMAKHSDGVKGFMKFATTKEFGKVRIGHGANSTELPKIPKSEPRQTTAESNGRIGTNGKDHAGPWSTSLEGKLTSADNVKVLNVKEVELAAEVVHEKTDMVTQGPSKAESVASHGHSSISHTSPYFNAWEKKLTINDAVAEKNMSVGECDMGFGIAIEVGQVTVVNIEKNSDTADAEVISSRESLSTSHSDEDIVTDNAEIEQESRQIEEENDQDYLVQNILEENGLAKVGHTANRSEVEEVPERERDLDVQSDSAAAVVPDHLVSFSEGFEIDSASMYAEEENVIESGVDPRDEIHESEDTEEQDYLSAEENFVWTDTDEETIDKDKELPDENLIGKTELGRQDLGANEVSIGQVDGMAPLFNNSNTVVEETDETEDIVVHMVTPETKIFSEFEIAPCFNNSRSIVEETDGKEDIAVPVVTPETKVALKDDVALYFDNSNKDPVIKEIDEMEVIAVQHMLTPEALISSEDDVAPCLSSSNNDEKVEEADKREDMMVQNVAGPVISKKNTAVFVEANTTSEDDVTPSFENSNEDALVDETDETEDAAAQHMMASEAELKSEDDLAPCLNNSNEHLVVEETVAAPIEECRSTPANLVHEEAEVGESLITEEESIQAEISSMASHASLHFEDLEFDLISRTAAGEETMADAFNESRSSSWSECQEQEVGAMPYCDLERETQDREERENVLRGEVDRSNQKCHESYNIEDSESLNHEVEAASQFCEPPPASSQHAPITDLKQHDEKPAQPMERHERKKWEIPRDTFELPELQFGSSAVEDMSDQEKSETKRQIDKHERKKWEIPKETFALPVLGDGVVEEENVETTKQMNTQPVEKPERKKWNIQKEVFEVPIVFAKSESSEQERFVIKTTSEEMKMTVNLAETASVSGEAVQHEDIQHSFSGKVDLTVPDKGASLGIGICNSDELEHHYLVGEWTPEIKLVEEEGPEKDLNETFDQPETKLEEGKIDALGEAAKGSDDINVKEEIKRTLGMLWKKIYKSKQDEDFESVNSVVKSDNTFRDGTGKKLEKDLNLRGPVELVESPRQWHDNEFASFSGETRGNEEFVTLIKETEVQRNIMPTLDSCTLQKDVDRSMAEEASRQKYDISDLESKSEENFTSFVSATTAVMEQQIHVTDNSNIEGNPENNNPSPDASEHSQTYDEKESDLDHILPNDGLVVDAEVTEEVKEVYQETGPKEGDMAMDTSTNKAQQHIEDANYSLDGEETLVTDEFSDKNSASSELPDVDPSRRDSGPEPSSEIPDETSSSELENKEDRDEIRADRVDQSTTWNWVFGDVEFDESKKQNEAPELHPSPAEEVNAREAADNAINASENIGDGHYNDDEPLRMEESGLQEVQKEVIPDQEILKKMMRAKEREKQREMEINRIVVERAIREARERAFAEAQQKAAIERANAEARQKVIADDRERSQRISMEAKLTAEKTTLEAKRKAELERAAVERVTAEARQRALQKAMSIKEQGSQSSSSRSTAYASNHRDSSSKEKVDYDKLSESALRFKARNEREQRISERAAKALAEKNMLDILVQREQAERNRLAEVLDADVKRWANRKTGNLRALLSTLQYILEPDSGWQPIHLTEIVTNDAVKKAYRKATLCVHPDKLQQRGASIKQKYVCEKVFDLLKEAWNRFSRDER